MKRINILLSLHHVYGFSCGTNSRQTIRRAGAFSESRRNELRPTLDCVKLPHNKCEECLAVLVLRSDPIWSNQSAADYLHLREHVCSRLVFYDVFVAIIRAFGYLGGFEKAYERTL